MAALLCDFGSGCIFALPESNYFLQTNFKIFYNEF